MQRGPVRREPRSNPRISPSVAREEEEEGERASYVSESDDVGFRSREIRVNSPSPDGIKENNASNFVRVRSHYRVLHKTRETNISVHRPRTSFCGPRCSALSQRKKGKKKNKWKKKYGLVSSGLGLRLNALRQGHGARTLWWRQLSPLDNVLFSLFFSSLCLKNKEDRSRHR